MVCGTALLGPEAPNGTRLAELPDDAPDLMALELE
jgi:hypothetical protein